jgi:hypothetical protein
MTFLNELRFKLYCYVHGLCPMCVKPLRPGVHVKRYCAKCEPRWAVADRVARTARRAAETARDADVLAGAQRLKNLAARRSEA